MKENRTRTLGLRLTQQEYTALLRKYKATTCRKLSEYMRCLIFDKPVTTTYRNVSQDEAIAELALLRRDLNSLANNFNQSVKRLHTLQQISDFKAWLISNELEKSTLQNKLDEIKITIKKLVEVWLQ
jgi:hypothetical protein